MKSVFLTGAASGIGLATAKLLYQQGWNLGLADLSLDKLKEISADWASDRVACYEVNVTDSDQVKSAIGDFAAKNNGKLDLLINNAGILAISPFEKLDIEKHKQTIDVNVMGVINGCHAAFPYLKAADNALVINLSSASSLYGIPEFSSYSASKFAVRALTESLEIEWEPHGIKVCDILPPFVATNMLATQKNASRIMKTLGVDLNADDVAKTIMTQIESPKTHRPVSVKFSILYTLSGFLSPPVSRLLIKALYR